MENTWADGYRELMPRTKPGHCRSMHPMPAVPASQSESTGNCPSSTGTSPSFLMAEGWEINALHMKDVSPGGKGGLGLLFPVSRGAEHGAAVEGGERWLWYPAREGAVMQPCSVRSRFLLRGQGLGEIQRFHSKSRWYVSWLWMCPCSLQRPCSREAGAPWAREASGQHLCCWRGPVPVPRAWVSSGSHQAVPPWAPQGPGKQCQCTQSCLCSTALPPMGPDPSPERSSVLQQGLLQLLLQIPVPGHFPAVLLTVGG